MPWLPFDIPNSPNYDEVKAILDGLYKKHVDKTLPDEDPYPIFWEKHKGVDDLIVVWDGWGEVKPCDRNQMVLEIHSHHRRTGLPLGLSMPMTFDEAKSHNLYRRGSSA